MKLQAVKVNQWEICGIQGLAQAWLQITFLHVRTTDDVRIGVFKEPTTAVIM